MAKLVLNGFLREHLSALSLTGAESYELDAKNVRELIKQLDQRLPGIAAKLQNKTAVAIDGEIFQDAMFETLEADSEVYFLPAIEGG